MKNLVLVVCLVLGSLLLPTSAGGHVSNGLNPSKGYKDQKAECGYPKCTYYSRWQVIVFNEGRKKSVECRVAFFNRAGDRTATERVVFGNIARWAMKDEWTNWYKAKRAKSMKIRHCHASSPT